ncbi:hypothetical protein C495_01995 [Natronorubrum sulfidifaciens JCM 14089]|uniref:Uncharacterized protein n=1 Tax=Natronorubrum sulfidifaciens JCM 14089 TaxID=1230460 RepID=L9WFS4_9EURY|nr:hypothetical protein C495_01995 [Natronorubrum sulfidifaciens JCM 14089]
MFAADPTRAFDDIRLGFGGVVVYSLLGTIGLPVQMSSVVFVVLFLVLMGCAWPLFRNAQPRHNQPERS